MLDDHALHALQWDIKTVGKVSPCVEVAGQEWPADKSQRAALQDERGCIAVCFGKVFKHLWSSWIESPLLGWDVFFTELLAGFFYFFLKLTENLCLYFKSFTPAFYPGCCAFPLIPWILNWFNHVNASRILMHNPQRSAGFGFEAQSARRFSVWSLHVGLVSMRVLSRYVSAYHLYSLWLWVWGVVYLCVLAVAMIWWLVQVVSCLSSQGSLIDGGMILFFRQIGFNEECGFFWITAKECNMKSSTKHGQLFNEMQKGEKTAAAGTDVLWESCSEATRVKGNVRQLSQSCVSPSEPQAETSHEPLRARGGSEQDSPHSIQLPAAPSLRFFASVKRETKNPAWEAVNIGLRLHQAWSRVCQNRMCAGGICQRTRKASFLLHTLKAKTSAPLFFQLHLFIEYFISLLISARGKGLCGDLSLLSCKVLTLLLLILWTS